MKRIVINKDVYEVEKELADSMRATFAGFSLPVVIQRFIIHKNRYPSLIGNRAHILFIFKTA